MVSRTRPPSAQEPPTQRRVPPAPVARQPDDRPAFADPPAGFDVPRPEISLGRLETVEYDSKTVGTRRLLQVYLPPRFPSEQPYPALYFHHEIDGDETEWERRVRVSVILDNLIADGKAVPMVVVMPKGRAQPNDRPEGNVFRHAPAFARFERDFAG